MTDCVDHLVFANKTCPDCGLSVDGYGNTEEQFEYCCYPDCGCDGERLCMAGESSEAARRTNVEGMWGGNSQKQKQARNELIFLVNMTKDKQ